jgi:hypothetical protein
MAGPSKLQLDTGSPFLRGTDSSHLQLLIPYSRHGLFAAEGAISDMTGTPIGT